MEIITQPAETAQPEPSYSQEWLPMPAKVPDPSSYASKVTIQSLHQPATSVAEGNWQR